MTTNRKESEMPTRSTRRRKPATPSSSSVKVRPTTLAKVRKRAELEQRSISTVLDRAVELYLATEVS